MKYIFSLLVLTIGTTLFAQDENSTDCSKKNKYHNHQAKSNSLTVAQIAETEKYDVTYYDLDVALTNLATDISGTVNIHAIARVDLDSALFELFQTFAISDVRVDGNPVLFSRNLSAVKAPVNALAGQSFILSIDYNGTPPTAATNPLGGSGMTNASSPSWGNQVTWSLSQPFSAYEWWPCKQSLTDKADSCQVKMTVPDSCMAGSNGILENVLDLGNGNKRFEWKHRHPIDYYLISVSVAEYVEYNVFANPVGAPAPILIQNFIYNNPATLPNFQTRINETTDFLELYYDLFGPYPFEDEKYGHCMAPISGGMEHQTMTTQGFFEKSLTSHELAHQWFGDNVTCASWADIWVNEGFASYSEYLMLEALYPAEKAQKMLDVHDNVMSQPGGSVWVLDSLNESRIFSSRLTYDKGSAIIHTMRFMLNNDTQFFQALKNYQTTFADSVAKGLDVKAALETESGLDLTELFDQWYFGEGFPTYSARWNSLGTDLILEISHTASRPTVTPTFTNPIELKFSRSGLPDTIIRFDVTNNMNQYMIPNVGVVTNLVSIDPNNWVINQNGTISNDPTFSVLAETLTNEAAGEMNFFPNPTNDQLTITSTYANNSNYSVVDLSGREITSGHFSGTVHISLPQISDGTYLVTVRSGAMVKTERLIIKK